MEISIKGYIEQNFKNASIDDIKSSIEESIKKNEDITLPGLGVFFQKLWETSNDNEKQEILNKLKTSLN